MIIANNSFIIFFFTAALSSFHCFSATSCTTYLSAVVLVPAKQDSVKLSRHSCPIPFSLYIDIIQSKVFGPVIRIFTIFSLKSFLAAMIHTSSSSAIGYAIVAEIGFPWLIQGPPILVCGSRGFHFGKHD